MIYSEQDRALNGVRMKRELGKIALCALAPLALTVAAFLLRIEWLCMVGCMLTGGVIIFLIDLLVMPLWRYDRFLREITSGLTRRTAGTLVRIGEDKIYTDGVFMRECILNIYEDLSEDGERRFLLDSAKSVSGDLIGRDVVLTSHGNTVLDVQAMENGAAG